MKIAVSVKCIENFFVLFFSTPGSQRTLYCTDAKWRRDAFQPPLLHGTGHVAWIAWWGDLPRAATRLSSKIWVLKYKIFLIDFEPVFRAFEHLNGAQSGREFSEQRRRNLAEIFNSTINIFIEKYYVAKAITAAKDSVFGNLVRPCG